MLKLAQISDPHIGAYPDFMLAGVNTLQSFHTVLSDAVKSSPDLIVVSGDIAASPNLYAYEQFFQSFERISIPMVWLPGNHDALDVIARCPAASLFRKQFIYKGWQFVLLDSALQDQPGGHLAEIELTFLRTQLSQNPLPTVVFLHHHTYEVGSPWLDEQMVDNSAEFLDVIREHPNVRGVYSGHIHQSIEKTIYGCQFVSAPSTCVQFATNSEKFAISEDYPGYLLHQLSESGTIRTQTVRVRLPQFDIDTRCVGY